jgi:hypothetical protein
LVVSLLVTGCIAVPEPIPARRAKIVGLADRAARGSKGCPLAGVVTARPVARAAERIVEILKREDFGDHWQVLRPECVSD